jgi:glycerate-2-kinase
MLYPATVVGLIFSDVPGNDGPMVASGPTYLSGTSVDDAQRVLNKYKLGGYQFADARIAAKKLEKVHNVTMVSNRVALEAMARRAREIGLDAIFIGDNLYDSVEAMAARFVTAAQNTSSSSGTVFLAGGEPDVKVPEKCGRGGRNQLLTLQAMKFIRENQVFISFGSDGSDNGEAAGAIADQGTTAKAARLELDGEAYLQAFDAQTFFERTGDLIITGPTGANVSDLMILVDFARK